jgi:hypothetical protein
MRMKGTNMAVQVKTIGSSGQISLGKENAGRPVTLEEIEAGVWLIKSAQVIPENEMWLHSPVARDTLSRALAWAEKHPPKESDLKVLERKIGRKR